MQYHFERLEIYQLAVSLTKDIYKVASFLPKQEEFVLKSQLLRACTSVVLNVAEGSGRKSNKEKQQFIHIAIGSLQETIAICKLLVDLGELKKESVVAIEQLEEKLYFKLIAFKKTISSFSTI